MADILYSKHYNGELPPDDIIRKAAAQADYYKGLLTANQMAKVKDTLKPYFKTRYKQKGNIKKIEFKTQ